MRRWLLATAFIPGLLLACPSGALAAHALAELPAQAQTRAVLNGEPIPPTDVVNHHCHDLAAPVIRCFDTEEQRDADAARVLLTDVQLAGSLSLDAQVSLEASSFTYALAYSAINYGGSSLMVSGSIPDLGVYGWNDTISSFKSTNGGRPKWWAGTFYSGAAWQWGTSAWVPYVGDSANDRFSSVKNVP